jgi:hypothetical protein
VTNAPGFFCVGVGWRQRERNRSLVRARMMVLRNHGTRVRKKKQGAAGITAVAVRFLGCSLWFVDELLSIC